MNLLARMKARFVRPAIIEKDAPQLNAVSGGWRRILESFPGAWQRGIEEKTETITCYSTVHACLSRISSDIAKLPFNLVRRDTSGLWTPTSSSAFSPVLRNPNDYQTPQQFREAWILSKLMYGNTYVLKARDDRFVVTALYILDPCRVQPMVSKSGKVFYKLQVDPLNQLPEGTSEKDLIVPAYEVIHDRENCLYHPLIGVSPLSAAILPATKNTRIQRTSAAFFGNNAQPGGVLTAPAGMTDDNAREIKTFWNENFSGDNAGEIAVIGADMKFVSLAMKSVDAQLIEQLRYSDEQICHAFGIPPWRLGIGSIPLGMKPDDLNLMYYSDALQRRIEGMEEALDYGLALPEDMGIELDLEPLLRMDAMKQAEVERELVGAGIKSPNESRRRFNLRPVNGGDSPYLQQQNYSLSALAKRDARSDPFGTGSAAANASSVPEGVDEPGAPAKGLPTPETYRYRLLSEYELGTPVEVGKRCLWDGRLWVREPHDDSQQIKLRQLAVPADRTKVTRLYGEKDQVAGYEVEFFDDQGEPIGHFVMSRDQLQDLRTHMPNVRELYGE